ncbi:hypothetical protein [Phenylobacterium sp.]|jgi:hypothetical protein|uniref:hypothetical protein n=1 Tax=Phenylobacterium sp. TaxID=1871053 RepID=UPI002F41B3A8
MGDDKRDGDRKDEMGGVQGEGNYGAAKKFDAEERAFIEKGGVERKAREAEQALDGPEAADLEKARKEADERGHMGER